MNYEYLMDLAVKSDNKKMIVMAWNGIFSTMDYKIIKPVHDRYGRLVMEIVTQVRNGDLPDFDLEAIAEPHVLFAMILNEMETK